jgi:CHAT domain-containing protein
VTKVDAEGTAYFVRWFLQSLLGTSHGHADKAMLAARREAAASKRWKDPYYWSTFVLTGGIDREPPAEQHIK